MLFCDHHACNNQVHEKCGVEIMRRRGGALGTDQTDDEYLQFHFDEDEPFYCSVECNGDMVAASTHSTAKEEETTVITKGERAKRASFEEDEKLAINPAKWLQT